MLKIPQKSLIRCVTLRRSMGLLKDICNEWKENARANRPMPDPDNHVSPPSLGRVLKQPPGNHMNAIKDAMILYKKTIFDSKEAIREAQIDDEFIKQAEALRVREILKAKGVEVKENDKDSVGHIQESDLEALADKVKAMYPKEMPQDLSSAVNALKDKKGDIRDLAEDRLEIMASAMGEFMKGYREGKEKSLEEVAKLEEADAARFVSGIVGSPEDEDKDGGKKRIE
jgi:hypothetical protein